MRKILISLFVIVLLMNVSILAQAQEEDAKYNFGTMQAAKELNVNPGGEITTKLYFYNIYGNRATHIKLEVGESPQDWQIELNPSVKSVDYDVSGIITSVDENLYVEPSEAVDEIPLDIPEGIEYISSSVGYVGANFVEIKIKVPENEEYGSYDLRIDASAFWLGQQGTAEIQQSRSFDYKINIVSAIFYEKPVTEELKVKNDTQKAPEEPGLIGITGAVTGVGLAVGMLTISTLILIIVILFLVLRIKKTQIKKEK